ncbi:intraflagellar transport protein 81 homolog [Cimex lectularius]|uniref:Intraflagellar transport protein 81 homolog n=1 Tax=Cimex lectularius TaxID=79782 RepID=A0A8I6SBB2_CIMLE|nr:intraflagellar transport protein 81 homolog [Cimex lectularius]
MSETIKQIIAQLNKPPFNKNYNLISFDSLSPEQLLQVLNDVLSLIDENNKVDIKGEEPEETTIRMLSMLRILKYDPGSDPVGFRQGIVQGEKHVIHPILAWLLKNLEDLKKRAYLAKYLVKIEIPTEMLGDTDIATLYEQYEQLIEEFKLAHKESTALKARGLSASELRSDIEAMEKEKEIVVKKIERLSRKLDNLENKEEVLEASRRLRLERERQKELIQQRQNEMDLMQQLQQKSARLSQQLTEIRQAGFGTTPQGLIKSLEEELRMTAYIGSEKLPKELDMKRKEVEIMSRIAHSHPPTQATIDTLRQKIEAISQEVSELAQRGLAAKEGTEDHLAPFRQQAAIIARRKEEAAEEFTEARTLLDRLQAKIQARKDEHSDNKVLSEKEYKDYVAKLKVRSTLYKAKKAQVSSLVAESGVLARTLDILKQNLESIPTAEPIDPGNDENLEGISKEELLQQINSINNKISSHKAQIAPQLQELKQTKDQYHEVLEEYTERKKGYDTKAATLGASIAKLEHEVKELSREEETDKSQTALLEAKTDIMRALLERAENEGKIISEDRPSLRVKMMNKIAEAEKLNIKLREEQQIVKEQQEKKAKQRDLWFNLETLLKCKEDCFEAEKQRDGVLKRAKGAETLVFE